MWVGKNLTLVMAAVERWRLLGWVVIVALGAFEVLTRERPGAIESYGPFSIEHGVFDVNIYMKVLLSLIVLEGLQRCPRVLVRPIGYLATLSFGVFFVHYYFIHWGKHFRDTTATPLHGSALTIGLATFVVTAASVAVVALLRHALGKRSRYLVGC